MPPAAERRHGPVNTSAGTRLLQSLFDDVLAEKPLPGLLRKALMLAKVLDAQDLREWLEKELYGYESKELPTYRFVNAPIMLDADLPGRLRPVEEQIVPSAVLPQPERGERFTERVPIALPVGTLVETANMCAAEKTFIKLSPPHAPVIAQLMNARDTHGQRVTALYWAIQPFLVFGLLDTVRTMLADYVAELYTDADVGAEALPQQAKAAFTSTIEPFINIIGATNVTFIGGDSTTNKISNKGNGNYIVTDSTDVQINTTHNDRTKVREFAELAAGLAGQLKMPDQ
jgi:hypothetical protein